LKAASATLGLFSLAAAASDIETAWRTGPGHTEVALEATKLAGEHQRATAALRRVIETGPR